jgi:hypothetical protein
VIFSSEVQSLKPQIVVTDLGIAILSNEVQPEKAPDWIFVTDSGMVILVSEVQPLKPPIVVTDSGIAMLSSEVQLEKAFHPISVTEFGITVVLQPATRIFVAVSIIALQPSRESYTGLPSATTIFSSEVQPMKAPN